LKESKNERTGSLYAYVPDNPDVRQAIPLWQPAFFGDSNRMVKEVQNESYPDLATALYKAVRHRYLEALALVETDTMIARLIRAIDHIEEPTLVRAYRKIAAFYRFALVGEQQLPLPLDDTPERERQRDAWRAFWSKEAERLVQVNGICTALLRAVAYRNTSSGDAAEARLVDALADRYGRFSLPRRVKLLKLSLDPEELDNWRFVEDIDWDQIVLDPRVRPNPPD